MCVVRSAERTYFFFAVFEQVIETHSRNKARPSVFGHALDVHSQTVAMGRRRTYRRSISSQGKGVL